MSNVLSTNGLSVSYGGVKALSDVDLEVADGRLVGLIGPNGAGKTTLIDAVTGFTRCSGEIVLDGRSVTALGAPERARLGLGRTWQTAELYDDLTVRENAAVGAYRPAFGDTVRELFTGRSRTNEAIDRALALLGLDALAGVGADELTQGQRKLVDVARALAGEPRVVLLDEPAAGLDTDESLELGRHLRSVVDAGTAMLLVDHDMGLVLGVCDHVVVLEFGQVIAAGTPDEVRNDPKVIEAYLGASAGEVLEGGAR